MAGMSKAACEERERLHAEGLRRCLGCREIKPISAFHKDSAKSNGLRTRCRSCEAVRDSEKRERRRLKWAGADPYADPSPKRCYVCHALRPRTDFSTAPSQRDGLSSSCRPCHNAVASVSRSGMRLKWAGADPYADPSPKRCTQCARCLPRECFTTNPSSSDGLGAACRECASAISAVYRARYAYKWADSDPYADPSPKYCSGCRQDRPRSDFSTASSSRDGLIAYCRPCCADRTAARRALLVGTAVEGVTREDVYLRDGGRCVYCGVEVPPEAWHLEHITALVNGGTHELWNVAVSCPFDNLSKGAKEWPRVAFDPDVVDEPHHYPRGVMLVWVNGVPWLGNTPISTEAADVLATEAVESDLDEDELT